MRKLIFALVLSISTIASTQAQFKISNVFIRDGFNVDTATSITIRCVGLEVQIETTAQKPTFYLAFISKTGQTVSSQNIGYEDMLRACIRNGIVDSLQQTNIINFTFSAVLAGTKSQKLAAIRGLLNGYGIALKPDDEQ